MTAVLSRRWAQQQQQHVRLEEEEEDDDNNDVGKKTSTPRRRGILAKMFSRRAKSIVRTGSLGASPLLREEQPENATGLGRETSCDNVHRMKMTSSSNAMDLAAVSTSPGHPYVLRSRLPRRDNSDPNLTASDSGSGRHSNLRRRGAVKYNKVHVVRGHRLAIKFFRQPTLCAFCNDLLGGFEKQGYQCQVCHMAVHKKCQDELLTKCPESGKESESTTVKNQQDWVTF